MCVCGRSRLPSTSLGPILVLHRRRWGLAFPSSYNGRDALKMEKMPGVIELVRLRGRNLIPSGRCHLLSVQVKSGSPKQVCAIGVYVRGLKLFERLKFGMPVVVVLPDGDGSVRRRYGVEKSGGGGCLAAMMAHLQQVGVQ